MNTIQPINPDEESAKGRIALRLDRGDIEWLAKHYACSDDTPADERERRWRIRFRANAALHKAGA